MLPAMPGELIIRVRPLAAHQLSHIGLILAVNIIHNKLCLFLPRVICQPNLIKKFLLEPLARIHELIC